MKKTLNHVSRAEIADGLRKAKSLIDHPDKWCQYTFQIGKAICAFRALETVNAEAKKPMLFGMILALLGETVRDGDDADADVCSLNNRSTHAELMAHFDRAIAQHSVPGA